MRDDDHILLRSPISKIEPGLHVISVPIGRLSDITLQAFCVLRDADLLVAEDTRRLRKLLSLLGIPLGGRKILAFHDHARAEALSQIIAALETGSIVSYSSDAGTPLLSDPGYELVREALAHAQPVFAAPGPSAALAALVLSNLPSQRFIFCGFLPTKPKARQDQLRADQSLEVTRIYYETAKRLPALITDVDLICHPDQKIVICRELTKRHEQVWRGSVKALRQLFAQEPQEMPLKGEFVFLIAAGEKNDPSEADLKSALKEYAVLSLKDRVKLVSKMTGAPRSLVYSLALSMKD